MAKKMWRGRGSTSVPPPSPPAFGYFASPSGTSTSDGSIGDPWDLQTALDGGFPANTVGAGDTVWLRGGTYTGQYECRLVGGVGNLITFRGYPGERPTIDGNYDPGVEGNGIATFVLHNFGSYLVLRDVEITNTNTDRAGAVTGNLRGEGVTLNAANSKVINCVIHDTMQGIFPTGDAAAGECYGNLIYHNGGESPIGQPNAGAAIDLIPAGGSAITTSGSYSTGAAQSPATVTISHNNTGDYTVLVATATFGTDYTDLSATYDGAAMSLITGANGGNGTVALLGIAGHGGTHDVVVSCSEGSKWIRCIVQSFVNVHASTAPTAEGTWTSTQTDLPPYAVAATSAANHMVVDGCTFYGGGSTNFAVDGDNTLIAVAYISGGNNPAVGMSYAAGAANVNMQWTWDYPWFGHGHGMYIQENTGGSLISDNILYDQFGYCFQIYGSSGAGFVDSSFTGNLAALDSSYLGGLSGFDMTGSTATENCTWESSVNVGYSMDHLTDFEFTDNYIHNSIGLPDPTTWDALVMTGNTFIGPTGNFDSGDFPTNTYYTLGSPPAANVVFVRPNTYEANRANVYVYNWENLTSVSVDLSSAVANGTQIFVMNAQDYFNTPVWSGTYNGGSISLPMTGLTVQAGIGNDHLGPYTPAGTTGPAFAAFIVRTKTNEYWRLLS